MSLPVDVPEMKDGFHVAESGGDCDTIVSMRGSMAAAVGLVAAIGAPVDGAHAEHGAGAAVAVNGVVVFGGRRFRRLVPLVRGELSNLGRFV